MSTGGKYLNSPVAKNPELMTVLFYFPGQNKTESCEIDARVFAEIKAGAEREGVGIGDFISQTVIITKGRKPKNSKNYFMVNLSSDEQKELRKLVKTSRLANANGLSGIMKYWVLTGVKRQLQQMTDILRKTGKSAHELNLAGSSETRHQKN